MRQSGAQKLRHIGCEVHLIADGQIKHIVRTHGHGGHRAALEGIGFPGVPRDLILQFERTRRKTEYTLVFRIEQKDHRIGSAGE